MPATYEVADIDAIKALAAGNANERQQQRALRWIIQRAAAVNEEPYRSDEDGGERETSFALGRAFVGRQIMKFVEMPAALVNEMRKQDG
jgi:hypothetical protein